MKYAGGKARNSKMIAGYINHHTGDAGFLEPFCGSISVGCKVNAEYKIMSDADSYMISLWRAIDNGWQPPTEVSEKTYNEIRENPDAYPKELVAFVSHACSFAGAYWGGYARDKTNREYALQGFNGIMKKKPFMKHMHFFARDYTHWASVRGMVIYCDPPYRDTTQKYRHNKKDGFDSDAFWEQVKEWAKNNIVFISEFSAPEWVGEPIYRFDCQKAMSTIKTGRYTENIYQVGIKE